MNYCPLMMAANGLSLGDGPDAKALNKSRECRADCAWRIGDDCAMVVIARAAQDKLRLPEGITVTFGEPNRDGWLPEDQRECDNCHDLRTDGGELPCRQCVDHSRWSPR